MAEQTCREEHVVAWSLRLPPPHWLGCSRKSITGHCATFQLRCYWEQSSWMLLVSGIGDVINRRVYAAYKTFFTQLYSQEEAPDSVGGKLRNLHMGICLWAGQMLAVHGLWDNLGHVELGLGGTVSFPICHVLDRKWYSHLPGLQSTCTVPCLAYGILGKRLCLPSWVPRCFFQDLGKPKVRWWDHCCV